MMSHALILVTTCIILPVANLLAMSSKETPSNSDSLFEKESIQTTNTLNQRTTTKVKERTSTNSFIGGGIFDIEIPTFEKNEGLKNNFDLKKDTFDSYSIEMNTALLRFFKCFRLITTRPPTSSEVRNFLTEIYNKEETEQNEIAATMCVGLIKEASFEQNSNGFILSDQSSEDNINIVRNFNSLHRSWLTNTNSIDTYTPRGGIDIHESGEASLRYTLALFGVDAGVKYKSILGNTGGLTGALEGVRTNGPLSLGGNWGGSPNYHFYYNGAEVDDDNYVARIYQSFVAMRSYALSAYEIDGSTRYRFDSNGDLNVTLPWLGNPLSNPVTEGNKCDDSGCGDLHDFWDQIDHPEEGETTGCNPVDNEGFYLEYGDLVGVKTAINCEIKYSENKSTREDPYVFHNIDDKTFNVKHHVGGGAIGSFDYWANNNSAVVTYGSKQGITHVSNEDFARRWARHVLEDFLCREVPVLDSASASADISNDPYSEHSFRSDGSCLACHSTLDRMSAAARNIELMALTKGQAKNINQDNYYSIPQSTGLLIDYNYEKCYKEGSNFVDDIQVTSEELCNLEIDLDKVKCEYGEYNENGELEFVSCGCNEGEECNFAKYFDMDIWDSDCSDNMYYKTYCFEKNEGDCVFYEGDENENTFAYWKSKHYLDDEGVSKFDFDHDGSVDTSITAIDTQINLTRNLSNFSNHEIKELFGPLGCVYDRWGNENLDQLRNSFHYKDFEVSISSSPIWPESGEETRFAYSYQKSYPQGALWMKDINNDEVMQEVVGIDQLGNALSNTPDFYACAAKRYFHFFTGSDIPLFYPDKKDPTNRITNMSELEVQKLEWIINLGNAFKDGGSPTLLSELNQKRAEVTKLMNTEEQESSPVENLHDVIYNIILSDYFMESIIGVDESLTGPVELEASTVIDDYYNNLNDCASCHTTDSNGGWLEGYSNDKTSCIDRVNFIKSINDQTPNHQYDPEGGTNYLKYISTENPCESLIYLNLSDSQDECGNDSPRHGTDDSDPVNKGWMNEQSEVEIDQSLLKEMIENFDDLDNYCNDSEEE